jgi:hypothetical protein
VDVPGRRNLQPGNSVGEVQQAISDAGPGDVVSIADGTYHGTLVFDSSGEAASQVVIRPAHAGKVVWEEGRFELTGSHIVVLGLTITSRDANFVRISEQARDIRISGFTFDNVGSGDDGSSTGIIRIESDPSSPPGVPTQSSPPVAIDRDIFIDGNTFDRPRNTVLWVSHGNQGINFVHNKIQGPHEISGGETEALKFGYGTGLFEQADSRIAFNSITDWSGLPYLIGIKMSGVAIIANFIGQGRVEIRSADHCLIVGNVISDGDLQVGGVGHTISNNYVRTIHDKDSFGPFMMYASNGDPPYTGDPWFYEAFTNSTITDNVFFNAASSTGYAVLMGHAQFATTGPRPHDNVFTRNVLISETDGTLVVDNGHDANTDALVKANVWQENRYVSPNATPHPSLGPSNFEEPLDPGLRDPPTSVVISDPIIG